MGISMTGTTVIEHSRDVWLRRGVAAAIDSVVTVLVAEVLLTIVGYKSLVQHGHTVDEVGARLFGLIAAVLYYPAIMSATDGRTFGKILTGVRVVRRDSHLMSVWRAGWREVVIKVGLFGTLASFPIHGPYSTLSLIGLCTVAFDFLWPLWDDENRALHDFLAGTRVLRRGSLMEIQGVTKDAQKRR